MHVSIITFKSLGVCLWLLIPLSTIANSLSPCCLRFSFSMKGGKSCHRLDSYMCRLHVSLSTGGSWNKPPKSRTCSGAKGTSVSLYLQLACIWHQWSLATQLSSHLFHQLWWHQMIWFCTNLNHCTVSDFACQHSVRKTEEVFGLQCCVQLHQMWQAQRLSDLFWEWNTFEYYAKEMTCPLPLGQW